MISYTYEKAFFHLSVWLIGQGGWKFSSRPVLASRQFAAQAEKWCWAGNCKLEIFYFLKLDFLIQFKMNRQNSISYSFSERIQASQWAIYPACYHDYVHNDPE